MQNTSHAVMSQRVEAKDSLDDFPTPPWATRALVEYGIEQDADVSPMSVLEPACGRGHMTQSLAEYFKTVSASDVHEYGYGEGHDFLRSAHAEGTFDWVITNPPFRLAEEFIQRALPIARRGVAVLVRTVFVESVGRYQRVFSVNPPAKVAQFVERVPMVKGRVDKKASTATGYAWVIWEKGHVGQTEFTWVPPCRKALESRDDYEPAFLCSASAADVPIQRDLFL